MDLVLVLSRPRGHPVLGSKGECANRNGGRLRGLGTVRSPLRGYLSWRRLHH